GMYALKYAYLAVKNDEVSTAVSTGSERLSRILRADFFEDEAAKLESLEANPYVAFEKDFLRWMLSDGAAAFKLQDKPNEKGLSLRIEWLEGVSYANMAETCMFMGGDKPNGPELKSYMDYSPKEITDRSILDIKQDVKLLGENIVALGFDKLKVICDKKGLNVDEIDYFLPHLSSNFFRPKIADKLE